MRPFALTTTILFVGGLLFGCAAVERTMPSMLSDANLVSVLNTIDVSEIDAAQLAKEEASWLSVRTYAMHLIEDHTIMMQKDLELVNRMKVQPDKPKLASALESTHQETMEELHKMSGKDFDRAYIAYQVTMHQQALKLVEDTADSADDPRLQYLLRQARPDLQSHLAMAQDLQRQLVAQQ
jgi:putative membrane protein